MSDCDCDACQRGRTVRRIGESLSPADATFLRGLDEALAHAQTDAVYWQMKYRGTWPGDVPDRYPSTTQDAG